MNDLFTESRKTAIASGQILSHDTKELYKVEGVEKWNVELWSAQHEYPNILKFDCEATARECLAAMNGEDISK